MGYASDNGLLQHFALLKRLEIEGYSLAKHRETPEGH
jgi:hypothetical protein